MAGRPQSPDDMIEIGRVGKPHGVRGSFHLDGAIDADVLRPGFALWIADEEHEVLARGGTDARPLVTLRTVGDRDAIQALRGSAVTAPRSTLTPLGEGEWYAQDLIGLDVVTRDGQRLGAVERMTNAPSVDLLEVAGGEGPLLVPMLRDAIDSIDPAEGRVVVNADFLDLG